MGLELPQQFHHALGSLMAIDVLQRFPPFPVFNFSEVSLVI
jgi:hypothetical protein